MNNIVEGKGSFIVGLVLGTGLLVGVLYIAKDALIDVGWGEYVPYIIGGVIASTAVGVVVGIRYSETRWFRAMDSFIKKWGILMGGILVLAAALITIFL